MKIYQTIFLNISRKVIFIFALLTYSLSLTALTLALNSSSEIGSDNTIRLCLGESVDFELLTSYTQPDGSDGSTIFTWSIADAEVSEVGLTSYTYEFDAAGGYIVQVRAVDPINDEMAQVNVVVLVSGPPNFNNVLAENPDVVYWGSAAATLVASLTPGVGYVASRAIVFDDGTQLQTSAPFGLFSDQIMLSTTVQNAFLGATIEQASDIEYIRVNFEHSFASDIQLALKCPSGFTVGLFDGTIDCAGAMFGYPFQDGTFEADVNIPGEGIDYFWSADAIDTLARACDYEAVFPADGGPDTYLATQVPSGVYQTMTPLTGLIGCPVAGDWTLTAVDNQAIDSGWIFELEIAFDPPMTFDLPDAQVELVSLEWLDAPGVTVNYWDSIFIEPTVFGPSIYPLQVTDEFGCVYVHEHEVSLWVGLGVNEQQIEDLEMSYEADGVVIRDLSLEDRSLQLRVFDLSGREIQKRFFKRETRISASDKGILLTEVVDAQSGLRKVFKLNLSQID